MSKLMFLARRFVAGLTAEEAMPAVRVLNARGIRATLTVLGENVTRREEAVQAADDFLHLLDLIQERSADASVSLKLTQMGLDIDASFCLDNAMRVVERAAEADNFVRIDMEGPEHTQAILDVFERLHRERENVGVAVQAMLLRSARDVPELLARGARLRLCKGAYKFPASIAHLRKAAIARAFTDLAARLLASGTYHGIATHDESLIQWVMDRVHRQGLDRRAFEFQMLHGLRPHRQVELAEAGYNVRCYVPFGPHWFAYFSRRLRERKENVFFVLKHLLMPS